MTPATTDNVGAQTVRRRHVGFWPRPC